VLFGDLNTETTLILRELGLTRPESGSLADADEIVLVDTHHVRQLPGGFPLDRVVEIVDHHPYGDVAAFPNARIHNEEVGAAATLIAERLRPACPPLPAALAALLACGIVSNTLDFRAPSTHQRDRAAYAALARVARPSVELVALAAKMSVARGALLAGDTSVIIGGDCKQFATPAGDVLISQVEAPGAAGLLDRADLLNALRAAAAQRGADAALLNLVDLDLGVSVLVTTSPALWDALSRIPSTKASPHVTWAGEMLLRKTHLVPALLAAAVN
jgi:manganese-dependent inorganic pyrophosphatase